jgi:hypothetical protein
VSLGCGGVKCICMIKRSRLGSDDAVGLNNEKDVASVINSDAAFLEPLAEMKPRAQLLRMHPLCVRYSLDARTPFVI